jgi:hypothetical protein
MGIVSITNEHDVGGHATDDAEILLTTLVETMVHIVMKSLL